MNVPLLALQRSSKRERLAVRWIPWAGDHKAVQIAVERLEGTEWRKLRWLDIPPSELFVLSDALLGACNVLLGKEAP